MYTSKFKLVLHWLLFIVGFYFFWGLAYLILAKFAISQFSRFEHSSTSLWPQLTASDIFWYAMFVFGITIVIYVIKKIIEYSPNRKIASLIFAVLIIGSVLILMDKILETSTIFYIIPHLIINIAFLVPIITILFKKDRDDIEEQDDTEELT